MGGPGRDRSARRGAGIGLVAGPSLAAGAAVGASGGGDPCFPQQGNGGYGVGHDDLTLGYPPATRVLTGVATIQATATQSLSRFDLDLRRTLTVSSVTVDGRPAAFAQPAQQDQELVVTPVRPLAGGASFTVVVTYGGVPQADTDPDGSLEGWVATDDGAFVVDEPQGSPSWFPCDDSPRDKATFDVHVTVPQGVTAIANGERVATSTSGGTTPPARWSTTHRRSATRWRRRAGPPSTPLPASSPSPTSSPTSGPVTTSR
jgi:aminopeptidase N